MSELKYCAYCKESKPRSEFYKSKGVDGLRSYCKPCTSAEALTRQRNFKTKCIEYKGGKCEICGYKKFQGALEFHHRDPSQKDFTLSLPRGWKFNKRVINELDKCQILCSNCHKEVHHEINKNKGYARKK